MPRGKKYALYIYHPDNAEDVACTVEDDAPFLPFQRGDLINPRTWTSHYHAPFEKSPINPFGLVLRVSGVEHLILQPEEGGGYTQHCLRVYTTAEPDLVEARLPAA